MTDLAHDGEVMRNKDEGKSELRLQIDEQADLVLDLDEARGHSGGDSLRHLLVVLLPELEPIPLQAEPVGGHLRGPIVGQLLVLIGI